MPNNILEDTPIVISTLEGNPYIGIPLILPAILPVNLIKRESGVQPSRFIAKRVGDNIYTLTTNGYRTMELEGRLYGAVELPAPEWTDRITKRLDVPEEIGWVAPIEGESQQILVQPLVPGRSSPPSYRPQELYRFGYPAE